MRRINVLGGLYVTAEERPLTGAATQPRRLAVLALLAVAGERGVSREQILNSLWPDIDVERGRHALTQALYALRHDLGAEELFLGQQELRLNPGLITSDYAEFHEALRANNPERAVECYRGLFLQGFHLPRADNFERWVEEQRDALGHEYGRALDAAAERAQQRKDPAAAVGYLKRRASQDPLNGRVAVRLMEAQAGVGDVVGALQHARVHEEMVRQELEMPPDPEVTAFAARLRTAPRTAAVPPAPTEGATVTMGSVARAAEAPGSPPAAVVDAPSSRTRRWGLPIAITLVVVAALAAALVLPRRRQQAAMGGQGAVVAVGQIVDYSGSQPAAYGQPLADMLATNLARGAGYRVISNARMLELIGQLRGSRDSSGVVSAAARQAGAGELIDGSLYLLAPRLYRLDLRRMDLATGTMIRAYRVEGPDLFALVDSGTTGLVADLGGTAPRGSVREASTSSVKAYQAYEDGLRRYYDGDRTTAERLFRQALDLDSGFAQAAFHYALATSTGSRSETIDRFRRSVELARHAGDRDRLIIEAEWASRMSSPALVPLADTLMLRFPEEPDGYYYAAQGAVQMGNYLQAVAPFRRILQLDSLGFNNPGGRRCRVCEAYMGLGYCYSAVDSITRAHAVFREWIRRQPGGALAWRSMAGVYAHENKADSALGALRIADSLDPAFPSSRRFRISILSSLQRYPEVERIIRSEMEAAPALYGLDGAWDLAVTLRKLGRLREALPLAHEYRMGIRERLLPGAAPYNALLEGQILFELGQYRAAAALFDSIGVGQQGEIDPSLRARDRIWAWVHEADARAELGDTARLEFLADTMEALGRNVAHARDRQLHCHVRGLLARVRGQDTEAAAWFRRAIVSPVLGFTRSNYELAGAYLRTRRPADAVTILRSAAYAGTDGSGLYVTQTDLEARLAEAFEAAGQRDSARVYYGRVRRAWEHADPEFGARRDAIARALGRLE